MVFQRSREDDGTTVLKSMSGDGPVLVGKEIHCINMRYRELARPENWRRFLWPVAGVCGRSSSTPGDAHSLASCSNLHESILPCKMLQQKNQQAFPRRAHNLHWCAGLPRARLLQVGVSQSVPRRARR